MKNQIVSAKKVESPLERAYRMNNYKLPTNEDTTECYSEPRSRFYFSLDTMRIVDTSKEFDQIMSLFGKGVNYGRS